MKIRNTENNHYFQKELFRKLNIFELQGLLMDENRNFTAAVEAIQFEENETPNLEEVFSKEELYAKYRLAEELKIPFYLIRFFREKFGIVKVYKASDDKIELSKVKEKTEKEFIEFWKRLKKTKQLHPLLNGAKERTDNTIFDKVLRKYNLEWGGNIDGFMIRNRKIVAIVDNISIGARSGPVDGNYANPALYFFKKGPRYETWLSSVKLAYKLNIPHLLFTIDKEDPNKDHIGFSIISLLNKTGIYYQNNLAPNKNVLIGLDNIITEVEKAVKMAPIPKLEE
ncbi:hypothetical protein [uncultured Fusobacterium sp.]|uniref:hypothetical protein n=1 Tax=uncultured Fusobacterium sp. TaxID=159267 RepID=UPI0025CF03DD|nr:hypothetical protein [uncultured Fusobacterium sp.]